MPRVATAAAARIGVNVADQRRGRGLSVDQLATATGIDSSDIRAYENGRALTGLQSLVRIEEALEVDPPALFAGVDSGMFTRSKDDA